MSLLNDLARIREMQGKEPLPDPGVIQGFGPNDPAVPPYTPRTVAPSYEQEPVEDEFLEGGPPAEEPQSPLIPRKHRLVAPPGQPDAGDPLDAIVAQVAERLLGGMAAASPALAVLDRVARWKGREVALSESDEKAVRAVVLKAIQRELAADLAAAGVRRVRKGGAAPEAASAVPVRRRGRPRKVTA